MPHQHAPKHAFVIGHPIAHSRSPLIHTHWLETLGIDGSYRAIDVAPEDMPAFFDRIRQGEFIGGNVTIPHKNAALELADECDEAARAIGAANTIVRTPEGKIIARNTDALGFSANLDAGAPGWDDVTNTAIIIGAGGAARAILHALIQRKFTNITVLNRTLAKAEQLASEFSQPNQTSISAGSLQDFPTWAPHAGLLINTSAVGLNGTRFEHLDPGLLKSNALVNDIVYAPLETPLLAAARAAGLRCVDGLGMLLHQAVPGFAAWFGKTPEVTPQLRDLVERDLGLK